MNRHYLRGRNWFLDMGQVRSSARRESSALAATRASGCMTGNVPRATRTVGQARTPAAFVLRLVPVVVALGITLSDTAGAGVLVSSHEHPNATTSAPGDSWTPLRTLFRGSGSLLASVSCASARLCIAVGAKGSDGVAVAGANSWSSPVVLDRSGGLASVSCLTSGVCEAVGASAAFGPGGVTYRRMKSSWSTGAGTKFAIVSVSCATADFCVGVDNQSPIGHGFVFDGRHWSAPAALKTSAESVSCPSVKVCIAIAQSGKVIFLRGRSWSNAVMVDSSGTPAAISCPNASYCVVVDANGAALTDEGGRWSKPKIVDSSASLTGVSCASVKFCIAVDSAGAVLTYDGSRWSTPRVISSTIQFTSVSCPSAKFCAAIGQNAANDMVFATTYIATY